MQAPGAEFKIATLLLLPPFQKERDAKEARQLDFEIKRQQGREAKQQFRQRREQERREQSKESADGTITEHPSELVSKEADAGAATQKVPAAGQQQQQGVTSTTTASSAADGQQQQLGTSRKHKLQIIQSLRQESSTESDSQSYSEFRGWVRMTRVSGNRKGC